jgi:oxygen-independent coproporphyrinogen-3 oxidase
VSLGLYISVPFCRSKCSYCNFASGVFASGIFEKYIARLTADVRQAQNTAAEMGGAFHRRVDSIYLGGGTPTLLKPAQMERIFAALRETFEVAPGSEITIECAPGTLNAEMLESMVRSGVNRVSLGVQSFVDAETRTVGRLHTRAVTWNEIAQLRAAGIKNFNIDLIAGLPHQSELSWRETLQETLATGAPHVSVYMLEVDEDSRLGREVIAGGKRYHAHFVPDENLTADLYLEAVETLNASGLAQYEISNFARAGHESQHNLKYWTRQPYLGFGADAHSFLPSAECNHEPSEPGWEAVRFNTSDSVDRYLAGAPPLRTPVSARQAREEVFFLGLRLNRGVDLAYCRKQYGLPAELQGAILSLCESGLLDYDRSSEVIRLTLRGRLLSNEVFQHFIS